MGSELGNGVSCGKTMVQIEMAKQKIGNNREQLCIASLI